MCKSGFVARGRANQSAIVPGPLPLSSPFDLFNFPSGERLSSLITQPTSTPVLSRLSSSPAAGADHLRINTPFAHIRRRRPPSVPTKLPFSTPSPLLSALPCSPLLPLSPSSTVRRLRHTNTPRLPSYRHQPHHAHSRHVHHSPDSLPRRPSCWPPIPNHELLKLIYLDMDMMDLIYSAV